MARETMRSSRHLGVDPDRVWAHLRDFSAPWHPMIATMAREQGGAVRAFTVTGEDTLFRERLTWFSDSGMAMGYTHLQGIKGARGYRGWLQVSASERGGSLVTMSAEIDATAKRAAEIAAGTKLVFDCGLAALPALTKAAPPAPITDPGPVPAQSITIDDLPKLALSVTPDRTGPLCLFLHGIGGNRGNWDRQLGHAGAITRAAAMDLRGYGNSTLGSAHSTVEDYCADIHRVMEVLGARQIILCGLSYGAWIATSFAMDHPELVAGLILSGGCTGMSEAGPEERDAFRVSREVPLDAGQTPADFAAAVIEAITGPYATDAVRAELTASMAAIPAATYRDALRCFTNPLRKLDFSRLAMPVLMMTGEHDRLAPPHEIKSVATRIHEATASPDVRFEMIHGAGHLCNVEAAEAYNRPLLEFLRRIVQ